MYASTKHGHTPKGILRMNSTVWFLTMFILFLIFCFFNSLFYKPAGNYFQLPVLQADLRSYSNQCNSYLCRNKSEFPGYFTTFSTDWVPSFKSLIFTPYPELQKLTGVMGILHVMRIKKNIPFRPSSVPREIKNCGTSATPLWLEQSAILIRTDFHQCRVQGKRIMPFHPLFRHTILLCQIQNTVTTLHLGPGATSLPSPQHNL